ncbi:CDP-diacylglycerol--glycerol-3-phosphate 3-phosphatidyltransferase [Leifsonia sp. Root112D2]|jgi:CDP-diacylglycerol--glycerol-3-phosphate 3-phosphatidyltransferase|uniref:CDP-diacylglycerol--glycerol-3-phosphate 3-phosphatidyltransferase n=1 Tax=Leifsonia sp. Root112D2 TaxID=1736426 RepID=UPI0006F82B1E|nr:CDP-diacylglycerol--glycerol-3-phosphate 3-phosphatidyltransferase [Leifsonia sp. Root112D2]KQV05282.1 CDP-diacylglycerol--glycerol-3-phosphate 3-phosphatidyltransferase [Leifsonia sp. Root112D2]
MSLPDDRGGRADSGADHADSGAASLPPSNWNVPNFITVVRILFAPVFMWMLLADNGHDGVLRWVAAALFIIGIATDGLDGAIARRYGLVTDLGKLLDPIADKILTGGALVALSILGELPWWVTIVILVREWGITVFRFVVISEGVIAASRGGKLKTLFQSFAISFALVPLWVFDFLRPWIYWVDGILMTIALILTVVTGLDYLRHWWKTHRAGRG